jgi:hypothetical protein
MYTIVLYVALCTSPTQCGQYNQESWSVTTEQEAALAFEQCAAIERQWMKEEGYVESDCYVAE